MLVLSVCGVSREDITTQYSLSSFLLDSEHERVTRIALEKAMGPENATLVDEFERSAPRMLESVFKYLDKEYGGSSSGGVEVEDERNGVLGYLDSIGFGEESRSKLRRKM